MKKIFRMALVFALAGATLMYTGCTKDYSEDINKLDSDISSLENEYKALSDELANLKSGVASLEAAYKAADTALENKLNGKIAEIEAAIAKKADKAELEKAIADLRAEALKAAEDLQETLNQKIAALEGKVNEKLEEAQKNLDDAMAAFSNALRALVVIPDFYFAGVEATAYDFGDFEGYKEVKAAVEAEDEEGAPVKFAATEKTSFKADTTKGYSLGQIGSVNYNINPSSFPVENAEWSLIGMDRKYVIKGAEVKTWKPKFEAIEAANGIATVNYSIENPDSLIATVTGAGEPDGKTNVPVMQLIADLGDATVESDWVAITTGIDTLKHLAFAKNNSYVTKYTDDCGYSQKIKDLYNTAATAVADSASVMVKYNGGPVDLAPFINLHLINANGAKDEWTLAELNEKYGDKFAMNFELIPYLAGKNVTSESMYGKIEGTEFTPCYVKSAAGTPESIVIAKNDESAEGISAVGRKPLVLATVTDENGVVVAYGYFKIIITKEEVSAMPEYFELPSFGKVPFVCEPVLKATKWHEFSYFVLEKLGVDYNAFIANYQYDSVYVESNNGLVRLAPQDSLGVVTYTKDNTGSTINDAITWEIDPQSIGQGKSQDIYIKFKGPKEVYFKMTAEVAEAAGFDFGANKISNEWYDDIDGEAKNTVRINVLVPNATDDNVKEFYRDLNRFYIGYKPAAELSSDSDAIYKETADSLLETTSKFYFAAKQPVINGQKLITNAAGDSLYVVTKEVNGVVKDSAIVASLVDSTGVITYSWAEGETEAKKLLNLWSYTETNQDSMLFANIIVKTTYGDCAIPAGDENFHVRFVRPLDVNFEAQDVAQESAVQGFNVKVVDFISGIVDWNKQSVIVDSASTGNMIENIIKGVNMYQYYKFDSLVIDLDNAERDHWKIGDDAARDSLKNITPEAQLLLGTVDAKDIFTEGSGNMIDISTFANLKNAAINYKNDRAVIETFNLYIPVKIYYSWGVLEAELEINVKPTSQTDPK